jgi:ATP-dependent Clp protease adaptor protein ClpS
MSGDSEKRREEASSGTGKNDGQSGDDNSVAKPAKNPNSKTHKPKAASKPKSQATSKKSVRTKDVRKVKQLPPFNVVLLDDNHHTVDYVLEMLHKLFGYPSERSKLMIDEINSNGRVIVFTTHKEYAELKRDQIVTYGPDNRVKSSMGSMAAVIEPAEVQ